MKWNELSKYVYKMQCFAIEMWHQYISTTEMAILWDQRNYLISIDTIFIKRRAIVPGQLWYYSSLQLKGLQNCSRSKLKSQKYTLLYMRGDNYGCLKEKLFPWHMLGISFRSFNFDLPQFYSPLRCKDARYLIWHSWVSSNFCLLAAPLWHLFSQSKPTPFQ